MAPPLHYGLTCVQVVVLLVEKVIDESLLVSRDAGSTSSNSSSQPLSNHVTIFFAHCKAFLKVYLMRFDDRKMQLLVNVGYRIVFNIGMRARMRVVGPEVSLINLQ
eukprot:GHVH01016122.1.p1 GENE.GHVH01016122.1~~GHVH01016122.1.p1  ORF type:complete len:106 (+),score=1.06 GHVH01016122.1:462-779(+)